MSTSDHDELMKKIHDEWPKPSPGILLSDSQVVRVVAAARREGWAQAIEALLDDRTAEAVQHRLADEWHQDECACDLWPADCRTHKATAWLSGRDFAPDRWRAEVVAPLFADYLTDRAAALTEEGQ